MFGSIGPVEWLVIATVGLFVVGPERLPKVAAQAAQLMRQLKGMASGVTSELKAELGPDLADLDLRSLHPRQMVRSMWDDADHTAPARGDEPTATQRSLAPGERPPYDPDTT